MGTAQDFRELWVSPECFFPDCARWIYAIGLSSSDLGLLKRDKKLQIRYDTWAQGIRAQYGSMGESYPFSLCLTMLTDHINCQ